MNVRYNSQIIKNTRNIASCNQDTTFLVIERDEFSEKRCQYAISLKTEPDESDFELPVLALTASDGASVQLLRRYVGDEIGSILFTLHRGKWRMDRFFPIGYEGEDPNNALRGNGIATSIEILVGMDMLKGKGDFEYINKPTDCREVQMQNQGRLQIGHERMSEVVRKLIVYQMKKRSECFRKRSTHIMN